MYVDLGFCLSPEQIGAVLREVGRLDCSPGPGGSRMTPYPVEALPETWRHQRATAMVVSLYPSAQLVGHCDPPVTGTRIHVPVQMNDGCWVFSDGTWQHLELGRAYAMDPTRVHGAVNWGATTRLHLMVDVDGKV